MAVQGDPSRFAVVEHTRHDDANAPPYRPPYVPALWDRLEGETSRAFASFREYLEMGPSRGLRRVRSGSRRHVESWSSRHRWVDRAGAWDASLAREADIAAAEAATAMARRHIQVAQSFQAQLVQRLASMSPMELSMADLARWFDVSTRIEREARGLARMEAPVPCPQHGESATGEMVRRILADAEASQLALDILDRIAGRHEPACPRPTESEL